jgi:phage-related protein
VKEIIFYKTSSGHSPVEEFIDSLNEKESKKVVWTLRLVRDLERIPEEYLKKLKSTDGIWEIRVQFGNNIFRFLGFYEKSNIIVLTNGFTKKSQKTPKSEIELAKKRKTEYYERKK